MFDEGQGLFDSKLRIAAVAILAVVVLLLVAFFAGFLGVPSLQGVENEFGAVNDSTTEIVTDLRVRNPNPLGAGALGLSADYAVEMNDVAIANGSKSSIDVGTGTETVTTHTYMNNERIPPWWESHVRNDEVTTVSIDASIRSSTLGRSFALPTEQTVETNVIGQFNSNETRPINASRPLVEDPILYVNETSAAWGEVRDGATPIDMTFVMYNPKSVDYVVSEIGYTITMNDVVVGNGTTSSAQVLPARQETDVPTPTTIRTDSLDEWWVTHLQNDQVTQLRITFEARIELPSGTTITVPLNELTYEKTIETDIFGTKDDASTGATGDGGSDETTTAGDGTTPDDDTSTADGGAGSDTTTVGGAGGTETTTEDDGVLVLDRRR